MPLACHATATGKRMLVEGVGVATRREIRRPLICSWLDDGDQHQTEPLHGGQISPLTCVVSSKAAIPSGFDATPTHDSEQRHEANRGPGRERLTGRRLGAVARCRNRPLDAQRQDAESFWSADRVSLSSKINCWIVERIFAWILFPYDEIRVPELRRGSNRLAESARGVVGCPG